MMSELSSSPNAHHVKINTPVSTAYMRTHPSRSIRRQISLAIIVSIAIVPGLGGWAATTSFSGAVIAPGQLVVESEVKKVQHPVGGIVGKLFVRNGDRVRAGDVLIKLDETQIKASLGITLKALDELVARRARDEAERDGLPNIAFPADLQERQLSDASVGYLIEGENRLFLARLASRDGQRSQLTERAAQLTEEIGGLLEQATAKSREVELIGSELKGVRELYSKNLVPLSRVTSLERDGVRLVGERGQLVASVASARGKIAETKLQILQIDAEMRAEIGRDLSEIRGRLSELGEKKIAAEDQLRRIDLRAPQDGVVHQMTVHTVGGLVTPNEPAMLIVPVADRLAVEATIQPQEIDSVSIGQTAILRFTAFDMRTTPEVMGTVSRVSPDVTTDPRSGQSRYTVRVNLAAEELEKLGDLRLVPGMPVEAHLKTRQRTVISYLAKPLSDQVSKAWRER